MGAPFSTMYTRAAARIAVRGVRGNAHQVVDRRCQVAGCDGPLLDLAAVRFRRSNHLAVAEAAARQEHRHAHRPMIAAVGAALRPHIRRAAEFAHGDHQHVVEKAVFLEIEHQRCEQMIKQRKQGPETA